MALFQPWHDIDWLDQTAHAVAGLCIVLVASFFLPVWAGALIAGTFAVARELIQHPWQCRAGCRTDLVFWALGIGLGVGLAVLIA